MVYLEDDADVKLALVEKVSSGYYYVLVLDIDDQKELVFFDEKLDDENLEFVIENIKENSGFAQVKFETELDFDEIKDVIDSHFDYVVLNDGLDNSDPYVYVEIYSEND